MTRGDDCPNRDRNRNREWERDGNGNGDGNGRRPHLVLASASPRRQQLLADAGYVFDVVPATLNEPDPDDLQVGAAAFAEALSFLKARNVAESIIEDMGDAIVIGADTVVALRGKLYGKPADVGDARRILSTLMVETHEVYTGVTFIDTRTSRRVIAHSLTRVTMTPMTDDQLNAYLEGGLWQGKAGAYGIQDHDDQFVRDLDGEFSNVVGLPLKLVEETLTQWGYPQGYPPVTGCQ